MHASFTAKDPIYLNVLDYSLIVPDGGHMAISLLQEVVLVCPVHVPLLAQEDS